MTDDINKDDLHFLECEVSNTCGEAAFVMRNEAIILKDIKNGKLPISQLVATKKNLLRQAKMMQELQDLMSSIIRKKRSVVN